MSAMVLRLVEENRALRRLIDQLLVERELLLGQLRNDSASLFFGQSEKSADDEIGTS